MPRPTGRYVKGNVVLDYVKMIRANSGLPWADHLLPQDLDLIKQMILPASWYPLEFFQRVGLAVFKLVAKENYDLLRAYGASLADRLYQEHPGMITPGNPRATLEKYIQIQRSFYSFDAFQIESPGPNRVVVQIFSKAEEVGLPVYLEQISGMVQRLIELSGLRRSRLSITQSSLGDEVISTMDVRWEQ